MRQQSGAWRCKKRTVLDKRLWYAVFNARAAAEQPVIVVADDGLLI